MRHDVEKTIRSMRDRLAQEGVTHVAIFGSRARGDHRPESDLDLLIEVEDGRPFSLLDLIGVEHVIGDELDLSVSAIMRRSLRSGFRDAISRDVVEVY